MGRPANPNLPSPTYTPRTWATDAAYPGGSDPWSLQPNKVEPASPAEGFVPATGASAEEVNKLFADGFDTQADQKTYEQGLRDGANAYLQSLVDYLAQGPALRFGQSTTGPLTNPARILFNKATREWCASGPLTTGGTTNTSFFSRTTDYRTSWNVTNEIGAGAQIVCWNGACAIDPNGNIVIPGAGNASDGDKVTEYNGATWTKHAGVFSPNLLNPDVTYDPISGNWIVAGASLAGTLYVYTSTNRSAWTSRTAPALTWKNAILGSNDLGTVVMMCPASLLGFGTGSTGQVSFSSSTDGGVTWTAEDFHTLTFASSGTSPYLGRPKWTGTKWIVVASNATDLKTYVLTSPDGATWTVVATLTSVAITNVACVGELIAGVTSTGRVIFSTDDGVTWQWTDEDVSTWKVIHAGAGRFIMNGSTGAVFVGPGTGTGVGAVT